MTAHFTQMPSTSAHPPKESALARKPKWVDRPFREAYMEAAIDQGVAWQIRINRERRGLTQLQLAERMGCGAADIAELEDPDSQAHPFDAWLEVAKAFDCALVVKFISYADLAQDSEGLSEQEQYALPFEPEIGGYLNDIIERGSGLSDLPR